MTYQTHPRPAAKRENPLIDGWERMPCDMEFLNFLVLFMEAFLRVSPALELPGMMVTPPVWSCSFISYIQIPSSFLSAEKKLKVGHRLLKERKHVEIRSLSYHKSSWRCEDRAWTWNSWTAGWRVCRWGVHKHSSTPPDPRDGSLCSDTQPSPLRNLKFKNEI